MRSFRTVLLAAASLALVPALAGAAEDEAEIEAQLRAMQDRMDQMEERLEATTDELEVANDRVEQLGQLIHEAGLADPEGSTSSLTSFVDSIEMNGWLAVSWWYNFNNPNKANLVGGNVGANGIANPFNPDTHQFSFDQLWFVMERPIDEENRAGFFAEIAFGKTAGLLPNGNYAGGGNNLYLNSAYIQYLVPNTDITVKAGKFGTLIGAEVAQAPYNINISRGLLYNLLQPIDQTGVLVQGEFGESGFDWGIGAVNDVFQTQPDSAKGYAMIAHLGYAMDTWSLSVNGSYGSATGDTPGGGSDGQNTAIVDVVFTWDPTERWTQWINFDYLWDSGISGEGEAWAWGIATAGRYAITERWGLGGRLEYVNDRRQLFGFPNNLRVWSATLTADFALTDQLTIKAEYLFQQGNITDTNRDEVFISGRPDAFDRCCQNLMGVEAVYSF
jgi:hypothetical protein